MEEKNQKLSEHDLDELMKEITNDIENRSSVIFYVDYKGDLLMLTTGQITEAQQKTAEKMAIVAGSHSIILSIVLKLEIVFEKILYKIHLWKNKKKS